MVIMPESITITLHYVLTVIGGVSLFGALLIVCQPGAGDAPRVLVPARHRRRIGAHARPHLGREDLP
jgi:hypothetical protein